MEALIILRVIGPDWLINKLFRTHYSVVKEYRYSSKIEDAVLRENLEEVVHRC